MWTEGDDPLAELEAFAEDRMSAAERTLFEQRLKDDPVLAEQLAAYRATRAAIGGHFADKRVRDILHRLERRPTGNGHLPDDRVRGLLIGLERREQEHRRRRRHLLVAASITALLTIGTLWYLFPRELPHLAERYAVQEPPLPVFMSADRPPKVLLDEAMQAYDLGQDAEALKKLELLPPSDTVLFYTALLRLRSTGDAAAPLDAIIAQPTSTYRAKALYHRMLLAMRSNDAPLAQQLWRTQMALAAHPYRDRLEALAAATGWTP
jgi:hypothetical protein